MTVLGSSDNSDLRGPGGIDAVCSVALTSSVTLAVSPVLSEPWYPHLPTAGLPGRDKRDTPYAQFMAQCVCWCAHGVIPGECPHPALRCCCRTRSVTAKLNKPQNHPETCLKNRPLGPNLGLLVWDVQGQDLRSCTVKQAPQGFRSTDGSVDGAGSVSTDALQGRACTPQVPGCVVLWRSPLHTIYFQIHLRALAESVQITLDAVFPHLSAS